MNLTVSSPSITNPVPRYNAGVDRTAAEILEEARRLPPSEREWVAHGLLIDSSDEIEPEWAAEVECRVADAASSDAGTCSWEELESRLRARLAQ
jgi:hypothetical protein